MGEFIEPVKMRDDFAKEHRIDKPVQLQQEYLRIVSEASHEEIRQWYWDFKCHNTIFEDG